MDHPLVTVVCLSYNHRPFIREAVGSVFAQTYPNLQIILIDDGSIDGSAYELEMAAQMNPRVELISLEQNVGNCKAFNIAFAKAKGEYIIDFATDDVMMPDRIQKQVDLFKTLDNSYGVVFTDAAYIDEYGCFLYHHNDYLRRKKLVTTIPQGNIYATVIARYFISSPTMMIRKSVLDEMGGYDEQLAYEDFDLWIRSSRNYQYAFLDEVLTKVRRWRASMSTSWYKPGDAQLHSTYLVCRKIFKLNRTPAEHQALVARLRYELRQSVFSGNLPEAKLFYDFLEELSSVSAVDRLFYSIRNLPIPYRALRKLFGYVTCVAL